MDISMFLTAIPVILTILVTQIIKFYDKDNKFKRWYFPIALVVGMLLGAVFSTGMSTDAFALIKVIQDAIQNTVMSTFAIAFKKPLGLKLPGDVPDVTPPAAGGQ